MHLKLWEVADGSAWMWGTGKNEQEAQELASHRNVPGHLRGQGSGLSHGRLTSGDLPHPVQTFLWLSLAAVCDPKVSMVKSLPQCVTMGEAGFRFPGSLSSLVPSVEPPVTLAGPVYSPIALSGQA